MNRYYDYNEIVLNGVAYKIIGNVSRYLTSLYPGKVVIGDTSQDSLPHTSRITLSDFSGGIGINRLIGQSAIDRVWWSTADLSYRNHLVLPPKVTPISAPTNLGEITTVGGFQGSLYAVFNRSVRRYVPETGSWTEVHTVIGNPREMLILTINDAENLVINHSEGIAYTADGDTWDDTSENRDTSGDFDLGSSITHPTALFLSSSNLLVGDSEDNMFRAFDQSGTRVSSDDITSLPTNNLRAATIYPPSETMSLSLPNFGDQELTAGTAFTVTLPEVTDSSVTDVTYSLTGDLPTGLMFDDSSRVLSGTVADAQSAVTLTYTASKTGYLSATQTFMLAVNDSATMALSFGGASIANQSYSENTAITTLTLPEVTDSSVTDVTYSLTGTLPTGLMFDDSSRELSGTPTDTQSAMTYTYTATKAGYTEATLEFTIEVAAEVFTLSMTAGANATTFRGYSEPGGYGTLSPTSVTIGGTSYTFTRLYTRSDARYLIYGFETEAQRNAFFDANLYVDYGTGGDDIRSGSMDKLGDDRLWIQLPSGDTLYMTGEDYTIRISTEALPSGAMGSSGGGAMGTAPGNPSDDIWLLDGDAHIYNISPTGTRREGFDLDISDIVAEPTGIAVKSDGITVLVADRVGRKAFGFQKVADTGRTGGKDFRPPGISDIKSMAKYEDTIWFLGSGSSLIATDADGARKPASDLLIPSNLETHRFTSSRSSWPWPYPANTSVEVSLEGGQGGQAGQGEEGARTEDGTWTSVTLFVWESNGAPGTNEYIQSADVFVINSENYVDGTVVGEPNSGRYLDITSVTALTSSRNYNDRRYDGYRISGTWYRRTTQRRGSDGEDGTDSTMVVNTSPSQTYTGAGTPGSTNTTPGTVSPDPDAPSTVSVTLTNIPTGTLVDFTVGEGGDGGSGNGGTAGADGEDGYIELVPTSITYDHIDTDGTTMWALDVGERKIDAFTIATGDIDDDNSHDLVSANADPTGFFVGDDEKLFVWDDTDQELYEYPGGTTRTLITASDTEITNAQGQGMSVDDDTLYLYADDDEVPTFTAWDWPSRDRNDTDDITADSSIGGIDALAVDDDGIFQLYENNVRVYSTVSELVRLAAADIPFVPESTDVQGIEVANGKLYTVDDAGLSVFVYTEAGEPLPADKKALPKVNEDPGGFAVNDTYLWTTDLEDNAVYRTPLADPDTPTFEHLAEWDERIWGIRSDGQLQRTADITDDDAWMDGGRVPGSGLPITDLLVYRDATGEPVLFIISANGVWIHDPENDKLLQSEARWPHGVNHGRGSFVWRGDLYMPVRLAVYRYQTGGQAVFSLVGPDRDDGVPWEGQSEIVRLDGTHNVLLATVRNIESGTDTVGNSHILAYNGVGWQSLWSPEGRIITYDMYIGTLYGEYAAWIATDMGLYKITLPVDVVNPSRVDPNRFYQENAVTITPWLNADEAEIFKTAVALNVQASHCSATSTITIEYALDYDEENWEQLPSHADHPNPITVNRLLRFPLPTQADQRGIVFEAIRFRITQTNSGHEDVSPDLHMISLEFYKVLDTRWGFSVNIDLNESYQDNSPQQLRNALVAAREENRLLTFSYPYEGGAEETLVRIDNAQITERASPEDRGTALVNLIEL